MAKKLSKGGLKLVAGGPGRRPMVWRVTAPELSRTYTFTPGVVTFVEPQDEGWFADPDNTEGRVFEVVAPDPAPAAHAAPAGRGAAGQSTGTPTGGAAPGASTGTASGAPGGKTEGPPAKTTTTDKPAGDAGQG